MIAHAKIENSGRKKGKSCFRNWEKTDNLNNCKFWYFSLLILNVKALIKLNKAIIQSKLDVHKMY